MDQIAPGLVAPIEHYVAARSMSPLAIHSMDTMLSLRLPSPMSQSEDNDQSSADVDVEDSEWKRKMAANRQELRDLAESLPTRILTPLGQPTVVINEDARGYTYVTQPATSEFLRSRYYEHY